MLYDFSGTTYDLTTFLVCIIGIFSTTSAFSFCLHHSKLTGFHSKTILFEALSPIVDFKTPENADHKLVQEFHHRKTTITSYVKSKIPTSYFENKKKNDFLMISYWVSRKMGFDVIIVV